MGWLDPSFMDLKISGGELRSRLRDAGPIAGARAEVGAPGDSRFTATRIALLGPFALAFKKGGKQLLVIEAPTWSLVREFPKKQEKEARVFAGKVNVAGRKAAAEEAVERVVPTPAAPTEPTP